MLNTDDLQVKCIKLLSGTDLIGFVEPSTDLSAKAILEMSHVNSILMDKEPEYPGAPRELELVPFLPLMENGLLAKIPFQSGTFLFSYVPSEGMIAEFRAAMGAMFGGRAANQSSHDSAKVSFESAKPTPK